jgi:hypothetical protein
VRALALALVAAALGASGAGYAGAPSCYRVTIGLNGATGGIVAIVRVSDRGRSACRLRGLLRLSVRRADGSLVRRIRGNPARLSVDARLAPSKPLVRDWIWRNWCGARRRFWFVVGTARTATSPPSCQSRAVPSTLRRFGP